MRTLRSTWPVLALWGMLFPAGLTWSQMLPTQPAAYVLPPKDLLPEVPPIVDPILDDSPVGSPGFFTNGELFFFRPHLNSHLFGTVSESPTQTDTVDMQISGPLGTTVSPRIEFGYRLPQQLGEVLIGYRFETIERSSVPGNDITQKDRLAMNLIDLDYGNRHPFALGPGWNLRFNVGLRLGTIYFDTRQDFAGSAIPPSGVTEQKATNYFAGVGPEAGVDLSREFFIPGLAVVGRVSGSGLFGEIHQTFAETNGGGTFSSSSRFEAEVPNLMVQAGISYTPPNWNYSRFLFGYVWEEFWQIGRIFNTNGDLLNRGLFLRAEFNF